MAEGQTRIIRGTKNSFPISSDNLIREQWEDSAEELAEFCGLQYEPGILAEWADPEAWNA
jgi:hypothetical protein